MNNTAKKAYVWIKYLFFFGCDPIRSTLFLAFFALISMSVYFGLYTLFEMLITGEFLDCHVYMRNSILHESTKIDIKKCSAIDLHLSSKESTVMSICCLGLYVFLSSLLGNGINRNPYSRDEPLLIELANIDDEAAEKKEK